MENRLFAVTQVIVEHLCVSPESVTPDTTLKDLEADSLDLVEMVIMLEEDLHIELPDNLENITTVGDLVRLIANVESGTSAQLPTENT